MTGTLSVEPADPSSPTCTGLLGFPGPPTIARYADQVELLDIDGDGNRDIAHGRLGLGIARGNGNGTFQDSTALTLPGAAVGSYRFADVSGDARPDLVFNASPQAFMYDLRVAVNDGNGGFGTPQVYDTGNEQLDQIEVADLNADGKPDVVGLETSDATAIVLLQTATGFAAAQVYSVGTLQQTESMAVADLTGDGLADIVVTTSVGGVGALRVLVNAGDGTFASPISYPTPPRPRAIVVVDVNADGMRDVVVDTSAGASQLSVLLNQGSGVLGAATSFPIGGSALVYRMAAADVNGDGHVDIGIPRSAPDGARILLGDGSGQFGDAITITHDTPVNVAFGDLDNDGRADMVLAGATITPFLSATTPGVFEARSSYEVGGGRLSRGARMLDLNTDGQLDLLGIGSTEGSPATGRIAVRLATGGGAFSAVTAVGSPVVPLRSVVSDLDNDQRADLLLLGYEGVQPLLNNGDGTLAAAAPLLLPRSGSFLASVDLDGNGIRDVIVGDADSSAPFASDVRYFPGLGAGTYGAGAVVWSGEALNGLAATDLNGDGRLDLVVGSHSGEYRQEVLLATGNGAFAAPVLTTVAGLPRGLLFARDLNADGKLDVIGYSMDGVVAMLGTGDGTLGAPLHSAARRVSSGGTSDLAFADFDGDGHLDIVVSFTNAVIGIMLGRGDGTFEAPLHYEVASPGTAITTLTVGDVDGDGRVDILVNNVGEQVSVLYGRCL